MIIYAKELLLDWFMRNCYIYSIELSTSSDSSLCPFEYFLMKACSSSYLASGRFVEFIYRHCLMKLLNYADHKEGSLNDWTGFDFIMNRAMKGLICEFGT